MIYNNIGDVVNSIYNSQGLQANMLYDSSGNLLTQSENKTLKVMTYNIGIFTGRNTLDVLQHIVNTYDADLIGLQEVQKTSLNSNFNKAFGNYPYYKLGTQYNKDGILSKTELINTSSTLYNYNTLEQRAFTKGYINFNGQQICFINTHLEQTSGGEAKVRQAQQLHEILQNEEYFILTGDFNTICHDVNHSEYLQIIKPFLDMGAHSVNCTAESGFINTWTDKTTLTQDNGHPCDHIIVSNKISVKNVIFDQYKNTINSSESVDHIPIIAELEIK